MADTTFPEFLKKLRSIDPQEYEGWISEIKKLSIDKQDILLE
jgi:hypothetical protein